METFLVPTKSYDAADIIIASDEDGETEFPYIRVAARTVLQAVLAARAVERNKRFPGVDAAAMQARMHNALYAAKIRRGASTVGQLGLQDSGTLIDGKAV